LAEAGIGKGWRGCTGEVNLELKKYLDSRGEKKLKGNSNFELKDPTGIQEKM
jgi:hypothetical protein